MKRLLSVLLCIFFLTGCTAIHYSNEKSIEAKASDIKSPWGKVKKADLKFRSTFDIWFPWKFKEKKNEKDCTTIVDDEYTYYRATHIEHDVGS